MNSKDDIWIILWFFHFLTTLGPWWQNALTNITESLHLDRSHVTWHWLRIMIDADSATVIITNDLGRSRLKCFLRCHTTVSDMHVLACMPMALLVILWHVYFTSYTFLTPTNFWGVEKLGKRAQNISKNVK